MTTPIELINLALKQAGILGVGQSASAEDAADCFKLLNMMLAQWSIKRNVVHQILDVAFIGNGSASYTVGPSQNFDVARPPRLAGAYCRQINTPGLPVDYPLEILQSRSDYARVALKNMPSMPLAVYYDPQWPIGQLFVWPVPSSIYEVHLLCLQPMPQFATQFDDLNLPPEYEEAILYNLAGRLCPHYQVPLPQGLPQLASAAMNTLRMANAQIGKLYMPSALLSGRVYNFYSDN